MCDCLVGGSMKFLHTGDLHIGKRIYEISVLEDQKYMLEQIVEIAVNEEVDAVLIAGDVYDRSVPSTEAVELLDVFLTRLSEEKIPVVMISGNHDSPERVGFADKILEKQGLYIAGNYEGKLRRVCFEDAYGEVCVVCLPFVKPAVAEGKSCAEAVKNILDKEQIDFGDGRRYVLLTHYFVTGEEGQMPELSESETTIDVGGIDNVPADVFTGFDYVALGHIHRTQRVGKGMIYYAGAPMKYSFSEAGALKSVTIVNMGEAGEVGVFHRVLKPLHEMRCIKGRLSELIKEEIVNASGVSSEDYIQATLTDREELVDPIGALRSVYPNTLQILIERNYTVDEERFDSRVQGEAKSTEELFGDFYEMLTGSVLNEEQKQIVKEAAVEAQKEGRYIY